MTKEEKVQKAILLWVVGFVGMKIALYVGVRLLTKAVTRG